MEKIIFIDSKTVEVSIDSIKIDSLPVEEIPKDVLPKIGSIKTEMREICTFTIDQHYRIILIPTGKREPVYFLWNGRGFAEVQLGKEENVTLHYE